jgi:hypothetical protein
MTRSAAADDLLEGANPEVRELGSLLGESALDVFAQVSRVCVALPRLAESRFEKGRYP